MQEKQPEQLATILGGETRNSAMEIALSLRSWLASNPAIGTVKKLSETSGVPYSTLKK